MARRSSKTAKIDCPRQSYWCVGDTHEGKLDVSSEGWPCSLGGVCEFVGREQECPDVEEEKKS